jgi:hypothetical protein
MVKLGLPEDITILIKQLAVNGKVRLAGVILHSYFRRFYNVDDTVAARWISIYFQREFSKEFSKHRSLTATKY